MCGLCVCGSNEIFDAFPCELIKEQEQAFVEDHTIFWQEADPKLLAFTRKHRQVKGESLWGMRCLLKEWQKGLTVRFCQL